MNYESLPFHRSWIALPDVQITRRVITLGQVASRKKLEPPSQRWTQRRRRRTERNKERKNKNQQLVCYTLCFPKQHCGRPDTIPTEGRDSRQQKIKCSFFFALSLTSSRRKQITAAHLAGQDPHGRGHITAGCTLTAWRLPPHFSKPLDSL